MTDESAKRSQQNESGGLDPGLLAILFVVQVAFLAWFLPPMWEAYTTGGVESLWQSTPSITGGFAFVGELLGGYANPDEHGASAFAFNWLYTAFLFMLVLGVIWLPMHFRQAVNDVVGGGSRD